MYWFWLKVSAFSEQQTKRWQYTNNNKSNQNNNKKLKRKWTDVSAIDYFKVSMEKAVLFQERSLEILEKVANEKIENSLKK